jgi:hypothetical protein
MLPTYDFQVAHYRQRPWIGSILSACRDPEQAFENWMQRDYLFGQEVQRQASALGFSVMLVDGALPIESEYERICAQFGLE